jgi:hypothetical protein
MRPRTRALFYKNEASYALSVASLMRRVFWDFRGVKVCKPSRT